VIIALVALLGLTILGFALVSRGVNGAVRSVAGPNGGGWSGTRTGLKLGAAGSDGTLEFTVFQAYCTTAKATTCTVDAQLHNTTDTPQFVYAGMQRVYTSDTEWVTPDPAATAQLNGGLDAFVDPLPPGGRRLVAMRFALPPGAAATRVELREGAFARGVYLDLTS
jgi:hypothetical protein